MSEQSFVIYRKYRPRSFAEIIGQEHIVQTLKNSIAFGKIAHAYLFSGPRGCGKTSIARIFSKSANCVGRGDSPEPCDKCQNCVEFNSGKSFDLIEIDAASNRGIDEIKNLRENVRFGPTSGKYKVYLIDEAHMLTPPAFNAFLKTLEEPPAHAVFILATTEANRIPATIISRVQKFDFKRISTGALASRLKLICDSEKVSADPEVISLIAGEADGSSRDAEGMLGQIFATGEKNITLENAEEILGLFSHKKTSSLVELAISGNRNEALRWLQKNSDSGSDMGQLLKSLNHYLRKLMLVGMSPELADNVKLQVSDNDFEILKNQTGKTSPSQIVEWLKILSETKKNLDYYPLPQMAVEVALINLISEKSDLEKKISSVPVDPNEAPRISNDKFPTPKENKFPTGQVSKQTPISKINKEDLKNPNLALQDSSCELSPFGRSAVSRQDASFKIQDSSVVDEVRNKWDDIVAEVRQYNHSLFSFLQAMKPKSATDATLTISAKYGFHKERINEMKNKKIVEDAVQKVVGRRLLITCELEK